VGSCCGSFLLASALTCIINNKDSPSPVHACRLKYSRHLQPSQSQFAPHKYLKGIAQVWTAVTQIITVNATSYITSTKQKRLIELDAVEQQKFCLARNKYFSGVNLRDIPESVVFNSTSE